MTKVNRKVDLRFIAVLSTWVLIVIGCAATSVPDPQPGVATESPPPAVDGQLEEIVTTASRARSRAVALQPEPALLSQIRAFASGRDDYPGAKPVSFDEELWVISVPHGNDQTSTDDEAPGSGAMVANFPGEVDEITGTVKTIPLPLQHTSVDARIDGYISAVNVRQQFSNPFDEKIEAVYLFPLPEKAAVSEFLMIIGDRKIRGILREKEEAEAIYREARRQGYQASLLVQHRPNVFEQKVANIEPGKSIEVDIQYFHTLSYNDGWYSFVFPTVVGPRYNPPGHTDAIVPAPRGTTQDKSGQTTVSYLRPDERSAHDISISVEIDAGVAIEELKSTHEIVAARSAPDLATVKLAASSTIPNKDFVLSFRVAGEEIRSSLMTYQDPDTDQGYFTMMLYPPSTVESLQRQPMEMVFVIDCSGSMSGRPLEQAKNAVSAALDQLEPGDTFQIIRFSDNSNQFGTMPVEATLQKIRAARQYLKRLSGTGGTQMIEGVKAALDFPHDPQRLRFVSFMTDGYIGNEVDIIAAVHDRIGDARIFSFGVGSSVNRYLLERMAKEGRGAVAYLGPHDSATEIMSNFFRRISHPALTDLSIDWGSMVISDVYPAKLPDMFVGRSVVITGKYIGAPGDVSVSGYSGSRQHRTNLAFTKANASTAFIPNIWARLRIAELADRKAWEHDPYDELGAAIKATALKYQLVSDYTSFVAVDASRRTAGDFGVTVPQAVPVPEGVRYETTVGNEKGQDE